MAKLARPEIRRILQPLVVPISASPREGVGVPGWLPSDAFAGFDFTADEGYLGGRKMTFTDWWTAVGGVYSRTGNKPYIGPGGVRMIAAAGTWPTEYDPQTGQVAGKSIWPAITLSGLARRDLTDAAWVKSNTTAARDQVGLDGVTNRATRITATATNGTILQSVVDATSRTWAMAAYVKRITGVGPIQVTVDGGAHWNDVASPVADGGFYRAYCIINPGIANPQYGFRLGTSGDEIAVDYAQLSQMERAGPPLDDGESLAVERAYFPISGLPGFDPAVGAAVVIARVQTPAPFSRHTFSINDNTVNEQLLTQLAATFDAVDGGASVLTVSNLSPTYNPSTTRNDRLRMRLAGKWKINAYRVAQDGYTSDEDTSASLATVTRIDIGSRIGDRQFGGIIGGMAFSAKDLDAAGLARFSASKDPILVWGDSLSFGTNGDHPDTRWMGRLTDRVARNVPRTVMTNGVGGTTSSQCVTTFTADTLHYAGWTHIFWTGQNDANGASATTIANYQALIALAEARGSRWAFINQITVAGDGGTKRADKDAVNAWLVANWPDNTIDVRGYLLTKGDGSGGDNAAVAAGNIPPSLLSDAIHPTNKGEVYVEEAVRAWLNAKGW